MFDSNPLNFENTTIGNSTLISFKYTLQSSVTTSQVRLKVGVFYPPTANFMFSPYPASITEPVNFTDTSTDSLNGSIVSREWNFGDGSPIVETNETFLTHLFERKMFYNVTLTVKDSNNLTHSATRVIWIQNLGPSASFTFQPTTILTGWEIQFNASESYDVDGSIEKYSWNFGGGANITFIETIPLTTHVFEHVGIYNTTLIVQDDDGSKNSIRHLISVEKGPSILTIESPSTVKLEETFLINLTLTNKAGLPLSNSEVSLFVYGNSVAVSKNSTTDINGLAEVTFSLNTLGNYQIEGEFLGDSNYFGNNASTALLVNQLDTHISIHLPQNITQNQPLIIAVTLKNENGALLENLELNFYIEEGETWVIIGSSFTDQDGEASLDYIPQTTGVSSFRVAFEGTETYLGTTSEGSLEVLPTGIDYLIVVLLAAVAGGVILLFYLILRRKSSTSLSPPS
jgi:PKD repeat protein